LADETLNYTLNMAIKGNDTLLNEVLKQTATYVYIDSKGDRNDHQFVYEQSEKMQADLSFHAACPNEANLKLAAGSPVWVYNFDYWSDNVFATDYPFQKGAPHAHELCYLFLLPITPETEQGKCYCPDNYDGERRVIADYLGEMWTNYAIKGDPSPQALPWPPFHSLTDASAMTIRTTLSIEPKYYLDVTNFWYQLVPNIEQDFADSEKGDTTPAASTTTAATSGSGMVQPTSVLAMSILLCATLWLQGQ